MSFTLRSLAPTGWEPEVTENDTLVFDSSRSFNDTPYDFALRKDTLTWYLLKTVVGPEGLVYFEDCQGKKHDQDSYIESLPVKGILRNVSRD
jgi:hypothetical protein